MTAPSTAAAASTCTLIDLTALLALWSEPFPAGADGETALRRFYADPCVINGTATTVAELAAGVRSLQGALAAPSRNLLSCSETDQTVVFAFELRGRHIGPLRTSAGVIAATGADLHLRIIDILTIADGVITDVIMVADELRTLAAAGAVVVR
ncbi:MAG: hypothetical protein ABWZ02_03000 [Nakamurella sp.]